MEQQSQAGLERQLEDLLAQVQSGDTGKDQPFWIIDDWVIQLGERKAVLHPKLKQWMWYDRLHDEWVFAGCGVGEAILISIGKVGGVKKLPQPETVDNWCVYQQDQAFHGPLRIEELRKELESRQLPMDILIWSTRAAEWFTAADAIGQEIIFAKDAEDGAR